MLWARRESAVGPSRWHERRWGPAEVARTPVVVRPRRSREPFHYPRRSRISSDLRRAPMTRFAATIFREGRKFLVTVDGVGEVEARGILEAEEAARQLIEQHVSASYPERNAAPSETALGTMKFNIEIVRADSPRERRQLWTRYIDDCRLGSEGPPRRRTR